MLNQRVSCVCVKMKLVKSFLRSKSRTWVMACLTGRQQRLEQREVYRPHKLFPDILDSLQYQPSCKQLCKRGVEMAFPRINGNIASLISCNLDLSHTSATIQCNQCWLWCQYLQHIHLALRMKRLVLVGLLVRLFLGNDIREWSDN